MVFLQPFWRPGHVAANVICPYHQPPTTVLASLYEVFAASKQTDWTHFHARCLLCSALTPDKGFTQSLDFFLFESPPCQLNLLVEGILSGRGAARKKCFLREGSAMIPTCL